MYLERSDFSILARESLIKNGILTRNDLINFIEEEKIKTHGFLVGQKVFDELQIVSLLLSIQKGQTSQKRTPDNYFARNKILHKN